MKPLEFATFLAEEIVAMTKGIGEPSWPDVLTYVWQGVMEEYEDTIYSGEELGYAVNTAVSIIANK